ncbi:hypothetical protein [Arcanobacterium bovis]|uniref:Lipoprotein n=1 Tax=Arcanobacterium bovis TaxID=2529275 RepID=A0A4Q9UZB3_9ACTO|nr:hypothetical protein [Arcanobacterium bovis]TBW21011.1 hypothetical protein EZJ44_06775 [Arcanobacterium bovis]
MPQHKTHKLCATVAILVILGSGVAGCAQKPTHAGNIDGQQSTSVAQPAIPNQTDANNPSSTENKNSGQEPNASLPKVSAPSDHCAEMNKILVSSFSSSALGRKFVAAQKKRANVNDPSELLARNKIVTDAWVAFVVDFWGTQHEALAKATADDEHARQALSALSDYAELAPDMLNGKVPQFLDEKQAQIDLASGKKPQINPEFTIRSNKIATAIDHLSLCMPSWPVLF